MLTVEAKLLDLVRPDVALYGQRDRQRVFLVRRMVRDLLLNVEIVEVRTVRGDDGLPVSTRVGTLDDRDHAAASNSDRGVDACIAAAQSSLMGEPRTHLEYLSVVDPAMFLPVDERYHGPAIVLIAASGVGARVIDNTDIHLARGAS